ncbi:MAG TPA: D-alanine--D-alanine ligase family protein [Actinomycetota bacterium]|nr:D-alanine--D-alanine ligase family protein [Actinomycetota bacterium]
MRVGVVFGGRSVEHDVSVITAHQVMDVLAQAHEVVPIYITKDGRWLSSPALHDISIFKNGRAERVGDDAALLPGAGAGLQVGGGKLRGPRTITLDCVVPAIHGTYGEDGTLQGLLELADIPYTGSGVMASALGMDKAAMKAVFKSSGLPIVPDIIIETPDLDDLELAADRAEGAIGYPAFVKPARLGSSVGIGKATDRDTLTNALDVARRYDRRVLVEKAMEGCIEVNCSVLGAPGHKPRASVCEQPVAWEEFLSFSDKYMRGTKRGRGSKQVGMASQDRRIPAPISDELTAQVQGNAFGAFSAIGAAGVARIDSFVNESTGETWVMEINTTPGSLSFYLWEHSGLQFPELMDELLDIALEVHRQKSELMFSFDSGLLQGATGVKAGG